MDQRFEQLSHWVAQVLSTTDLDIKTASGDASFRRYFRVYTDGGNYIAMDAPPDKEDSEPYVRIAEWLRSMGLNAPEIFYQLPEEGFYLLSDLGDIQYLDRLNPQTAETLYQDAINALVRMQTRGYQYVSQLPPYDAELLLKEMHLFSDWFLATHLGIELDASQHQVFKQTCDVLIDNALQQPAVFVHRDYHSRNLMVQEARDSNPGILDFQDAVYGPVTYDLVSLLRDCYINWPQQQVMTLLERHYVLLSEQGVLVDVDFTQYQHWFDLMGVQRHLKATGIFARLNHRDGKPGYLDDIPRTMQYIYHVASQYETLRPFLELLLELSIKDKLQLGNVS